MGQDRFVSLEGVSMAYGQGATAVRAVEDIDLSIERGEIIAVVGPSGCGKSSLLKLISGLVPPSQGRIVFEGQPIRGPLKSVGMAFQNANLLPWRNALDNVLLPLEIVEPHRRRIRRERAAYVERAERLLASVGLSGFTAKFPWELSGGMQQRTSICRALIHEPEILMLDEPFASLDAFTREELWCALRDLQAERKVTVLLVTHDLREAVFLADTVYVMSSRPGRIAAKRAIELKRPRDLEICYAPEFLEIVHDLRNRIGFARH
jgi:NitT/TauT family transport system ATP-binding protein